VQSTKIDASDTFGTYPEDRSGKRARSFQFNSGDAIVSRMWGLRRARPAAPVLAAFALLAALCGSAAQARGPRFVGPTLQHPSIPPDFALHDQNGRRVELASLHGKVVLLTFLYTHCPDLCPITAGNLNTALERLGSQRRGVRVLAVSVDPAGDTRASVRRFVREHQLLPEFRYLTGTQAALTGIWGAYHVTPLTDGKDPDHSLYTLLIDRSGTARVLFDATANPRSVLHDVRQLL
jgi:protein SCO1